MKKMILGLFFLLCPCWIVWGQQNEQQKRFDILSEKPAQLVFEDNFRHAWSEKWHLDGENAKIIQKDVHSIAPIHRHKSVSDIVVRRMKRNAKRYMRCILDGFSLP